VLGSLYVGFVVKKSGIGTGLYHIDVNNNNNNNDKPRAPEKVYLMHTSQEEICSLEVLRY
jgi:hypothetical protein